MNFDSESPDRNDESFDDASNPFGPSHQIDSEVVEAELIRTPPTGNPRSGLRVTGFFSWVVVCVLTLSLILLVAYSQFSNTDEIGGDATNIDLMQIQLQGKMVVAQNNLTSMQGQATNSTLPASMDSGPYEQRLCYSILLNELEGPSKAIEHIERTDEAVKKSELILTSDQSQLRETLLRLMDQYEQNEMDSSSLPQEDQDFLQSKLQWLGRLALLPEGTPQTEQRKALVSEAVGLMTSGVVVFLMAGFLGLLGFGLAILYFVLFLNGAMNAGFKNGKTDVNIYIETFAIWMCLFFGSSLVLGLIGVQSKEFSMAAQPVIFFGSLIALVWPIVRGVPFSQVRKDIGWTAKNPFKEASTSFPTYLATATFLIPGVIIVSILMSIISGFQETHEFSRQVVPPHPIQDYLANGNALMIFLVFLTACVAAPVVEETMFRGVLYRHLRDLTCGWRRWLSVIFAALLNGLIFASIHPQGMVGIPLLTTLAIGFSLAREWRGSLVCPMVMHGIHNALVTCVVLLIL